MDVAVVAVAVVVVAVVGDLRRSGAGEVSPLEVAPLSP